MAVLISEKLDFAAKKPQNLPCIKEILHNHKSINLQKQFYNYGVR